MQRWQARYATCFDALLSQPISKRNQFVCHKKRGKDRFVVSREPVGKINVEVVCSLACEAVATSVSGHRPLFRASTPHSTTINAVTITAQSKR
jgi:hypothetical protein